MKTKLRIFSFLLALIMCLSMFVSCSKDDDRDDRDDKKGEKTEEVGNNENDDPEDDDDKDDKDNKNDKNDKDDKDDKDDDGPASLANPKNEPYEAIAQAYGFLAEDLVDSYFKMFAVIPDIVSGTATYSVSLDNDGTKAGINLIVDPAKGKASGNVSVEYDSFSADADIWLGDEIVVSLPELLGDKAYGIKLSTLIEDIEDSWILDAAGVDSADELFEMLMDEMDIDMSMIEEVLGSISSAENAIDTEAIEDSVNELIEYLSELETKTEKDGSSYAITTTVTPEDLAEIMAIYVDVIKAIYGDIFEQMGMDVDDIFGDMEESMDDTRNSDGKIILIHKIAKSGRLEELSCTIINEDGDESVLEIAFTDGDTLGFEVVADGETVAELIPASGKTEGFTFSAMDGEAVLKLERSKSGDLLISAEADGDVVFALNGKLNYSDDNFELAIDTIEVDGDEIEIGVAISAKAGGKVKAVPSYVNLVTMSMAKLEALILHVQDSELVEDIEDMLFTGSESVTVRPAA